MQICRHRGATVHTRCANRFEPSIRGVGICTDDRPWCKRSFFFHSSQSANLCTLRPMARPAETMSQQRLERTAPATRETVRGNSPIPTSRRPGQPARAERSQRPRHTRTPQSLAARHRTRSQWALRRRRDRPAGSRGRRRTAAARYRRHRRSVLAGTAGPLRAESGHLRPRPSRCTGTSSTSSGCSS